MNERDLRGRWRSRVESGISKENDLAGRLVVSPGLLISESFGLERWWDSSGWNRSLKSMARTPDSPRRCRCPKLSGLRSHTHPANGSPPLTIRVVTSAIAYDAVDSLFLERPRAAVNARSVTSFVCSALPRSLSWSTLIEPGSSCLPCCRRNYDQQGPFAPAALPAFTARTDPSATVSSSTDFPVSPVIRPTLLR